MEKEEDVAAFKDFQDEGGQAAGQEKAPAPEKKEKEPTPEKKEKEPTKQDESKSKSEQQQASAPAKKESAPPSAEKKSGSSSSADGRVAASPLARKLAQEKGIDLQVSDLFLLDHSRAKHLVV